MLTIPQFYVDSAYRENLLLNLTTIVVVVAVVVVEAWRLELTRRSL